MRKLSKKKQQAFLILKPRLVELAFLSMLWLALAAGLCWAQEAKAPTKDQTLVVYIEGIEGRLKENAAAYLEINQIAGETISDPSLLGGILGSAGKIAETGAGILVGGAQMITEGAKKIAGVEEEEVPVGVHKLTVDERRLRWLHARAEEDIRTALQPFGYYHATVESSLEQTKAGWVARYRVDPGPPVRIAELNVQVEGDGADDPAFQTLLDNFPLAENEILVQPPYEELKKQLQFVATERGYFDAQLKQNVIRIDLQANTADVILLFGSGKRYRFGQVNFPDDTLDPAFLERYLEFKPGDPYDSGALQGLQSDLVNSNYFSRVELTAPHEKATDYQIPIDVNLKMRKPRQLAFGLGFGTDTGVRGKIGFEQRWVNRRGHRFNAELLASQIRQSLTVAYTIPGSDPTTDYYILRAGLQREDSEVKDTTSAVIGGSWTKQLGLWERVLSLDYAVETFRFEDETTSKLLMPGISFTRRAADDPLNITRGSRLELSTRGAYEPLLSDVSFLQPRVGAKLIRTLGEKNRLIVRGEVGTTLVSDFEQLPASLRFYAGGDNSVRGYELDKIGPEDDDGDVIGGKHLIVGSIELERQLWNQWSAAVFVDSGDAFDDSPNLKTGVGFGVRWQSPIGPIRVDIAHALDRTPGDLIRLHISIGPEL